MADNNTIIKIRLQPSARKDEICGWMDDGSLKVRVKSKPVEGKANDNLLKLLKQVLDIPSANIQIKAGWKSKNKVVKVSGIGEENLRKRLEQEIS